jgi:hypothetical protein
MVDQVSIGVKKGERERRGKNQEKDNAETQRRRGIAEKACCSE